MTETVALETRREKQRVERETEKKGDEMGWGIGTNKPLVGSEYP